MTRTATIDLYDKSPIGYVSFMDKMNEQSLASNEEVTNVLSNTMKADVILSEI